MGVEWALHFLGSGLTLSGSYHIVKSAHWNIWTNAWMSVPY